MTKITYHRDATVTLWDVYTQSWVRTGRPSDAILASLSDKERERVMRHTGVNVGCSEAQIDQALGCVRDMVEYDRRGDVTLLRQGRETLDSICASVDGYPVVVRNALEAAGLASVPRIAQ
jgi:hypothetical protein